MLELATDCFPTGNYQQSFGNYYFIIYSIVLFIGVLLLKRVLIKRNIVLKIISYLIYFPLMGFIIIIIHAVFFTDTPKIDNDKNTFIDRKNPFIEDENN